MIKVSGNSERIRKKRISKRQCPKCVHAGVPITHKIAEGVAINKVYCDMLRTFVYETSAYYEGQRKCEDFESENVEWNR